MICSKKNDARALSWATTKAGADVKKSELLCLSGAVKPYLYESYLLKAVYVPTFSFVYANFNKQTKRPGKTYFFSPNQTDYLLYKKRLWREILTWNQSFELALLYLDNAVCWCNVTLDVQSVYCWVKDFDNQANFCLNIFIRSSFS